MTRARTARTIAVAALGAISLAACTPGATSDGDDEAATDAEPAAPATVTVPPQRLTPFCQEMIDLSDRLENDPPDDVEAEIIETYERIQDEVPAEIRADFDAVLADLRGEAPGGPAVDTTPETSTTTTPPGPPPTDATGSTVPVADPFSEEGSAPEDDPALRLNAYVDFECRSVQNNPGPPATQPLSETTVAEG